MNKKLLLIQLLVGLGLYNHANATEYVRELSSQKAQKILETLQNKNLTPAYRTAAATCQCINKQEDTLSQEDTKES